MSEINNYIKRKFGVDENTFLEVLKMSPGAEGYIHGSIGELLFREHIEKLGFEAFRIKEKPKGGNNAKSEDARGDFYIRKKGETKNEWFVVECKGVKSNSEKRNGLTKLKSCYNILKKHTIDREKHLKSIYESGKKSYNTKKKEWESKNKGVFPNFRWNKGNPGAGIPNLSDLWDSEEDLKKWLENIPADLFSENAFWDLTAPIRLLQTHMPSTRIDPVTKIKSTGPLVTEFNILSVDLFLKTGKHEFVFVNSKDLNHQAKSPNHLQQNYTIDILTAKDDFQRHKLCKPWYDDIEECIKQTKPTPRKLNKSQLDLR